MCVGGCGEGVCERDKNTNALTSPNQKASQGKWVPKMNTAEEKKGFPARGRAQAKGWQWGRQGHGGVWGNKERDDPWTCQPLGPCSVIPISHFTSPNPSGPDSEPEAIALRPVSSFHRCRSRPRGEHTRSAGHWLHYFSHSTLLYRASQPLPSPVPGAGDTEVSGSDPALRHARPGGTKP